MSTIPKADYIIIGASDNPNTGKIVEYAGLDCWHFNGIIYNEFEMTNFLRKGILSMVNPSDTLINY